MCQAHVVSWIKSKHMTEMRQACQGCATTEEDPDPDRVIRSTSGGIWRPLHDTATHYYKLTQV